MKKLSLLLIVIAFTVLGVFISKPGTLNVVYA